MDDGHRARISAMVSIKEKTPRRGIIMTTWDRITTLAEAGFEITVGLQQGNEEFWCRVQNRSVVASASSAVSYEEALRLALDLFRTDGVERR